MTAARDDGLSFALRTRLWISSREKKPPAEVEWGDVSEDPAGGINGLPILPDIVIFHILGICQFIPHFIKKKTPTIGL